MSNVVSLSSLNNVEYGSINGVPVIKPKTAQDYLVICKRFLVEEDYQDICTCILDQQEYDKAEDFIKKIVDSYYTFI